jgi:hypothetical protein
VAVTQHPQGVLEPYHLIVSDSRHTRPPNLWTWFIEGDQYFGHRGCTTVDKVGVKRLGSDPLRTLDEVDEAAYGRKRG